MAIKFQKTKTQQIKCNSKEAGLQSSTPRTTESYHDTDIWNSYRNVRSNLNVHHTNFCDQIFYFLLHWIFSEFLVIILLKVNIDAFTFLYVYFCSSEIINQKRKCREKIQASLYKMSLTHMVILHIVEKIHSLNEKWICSSKEFWRGWILQSFGMWGCQRTAGYMMHPDLKDRELYKILGIFVHFPT